MIKVTPRSLDFSSTFCSFFFFFLSFFCVRVCVHSNIYANAYSLYEFVLFEIAPRPFLLLLFAFQSTSCMYTCIYLSCLLCFSYVHDRKTWANIPLPTGDTRYRVTDTSWARFFFAILVSSLNEKPRNSFSYSPIFYGTIYVSERPPKIYSILYTESVWKCFLSVKKHDPKWSGFYCAR